MYTRIDDSKLISVKLYYDFLGKLGFFDHISSPVDYELLLYQLKWNKRSNNIMKLILKLLAEYHAVLLEGPMVSKSQQTPKELLEVNLNAFQTHPTYHFVSHGLKLLESMIEGDEAQWKSNQFIYSIEQAFYSPIQLRLKNYITSEIQNFSKSTLPNFIMIGYGVEWYVPLVNRLIEDPDQLTLLVLDEEAKKRALSNLEMNYRTSKFQSNVLEVTRYVPESPADFVFVSPLFGITESYSYWANVISEVTAEDGTVILYQPNQNTLDLGIEPLLELLEFYTAAPDLEVIKRTLKQSGFTYLKQDENAGSFITLKK